MEMEKVKKKIVFLYKDVEAFAPITLVPPRTTISSLQTPSTTRSTTRLPISIGMTNILF